MQYKGIYWSLFAPMIQKSIRTRYGEELAKRSIQKGKAEYRALLLRAPELGGGNPMAMNAYFAYVFAAAWLGGEKQIPPEGMGEVMSDVLTSPLLRFYFGLTDLNRHPKKWYEDMRKYAAWVEKHGEEYPATWQIRFDGKSHEDGSAYRFVTCPICAFCRAEEIGELMPSLCATDEIMFRLQHGRLYREHTLAGGDAECDYWVVGDRVTDPK